MSDRPPEDPKQKFCQELIKARKYCGLDLVKISEKSKISVPYLKHLESGEWDFLPHPYVRSFLNTYATLLGMDVAEVLQEFDRITKISPVPKPIDAVSLDATPVENISRQRRSPQPTNPRRNASGWAPFTIVDLLYKPVFWISIAVLVVLVLMITQLRKNPGEDVVEIPFEEVAEDHDRLISSQPQDTMAAITTAPKVHVEEEITFAVNLQLDASGRCYYRVYLDGDTLVSEESTLGMGMTASIRADSLIQVVLGSVGNVRLWLNGRDLGSLGVVGQVARITVNADGIQHIWRGQPPGVDTTSVPEVDVEEVVPLPVDDSR